ncbi:MAG: STAS domain-containing protein, partial [Rhodococcus sp. (in: high G+C Gram-positive bacteria)]
YRVSRPHVIALGKDGTRWVDVERNPDVPIIDGVVVVRVEAGLFFANADHVRGRITALVDESTEVVILDAETSPYIDVSAARMLLDLAASLKRNNVVFRIARDIGQFRDILAGTEDEESLPVYPTVTDAIAAGGEEDR